MSAATGNTGRSWAEIVKGPMCDSQNIAIGIEEVLKEKAVEGCISMSDERTRKTFTPGMRGEKTCLCYGRLLVILGYFGWIEARGDIRHPDAHKNGGRIYVRFRDVVGDVSEGQIVCFYLYVDRQGLGAECCQAATTCDLKKIGALPHDGVEFIQALRGLHSPQEHLEALAGYDSSQPEPDVQEVVHGSIHALNASATEFVPMQNFADTALFRAPAPTATVVCQNHGAAMCARIAELFCDDSDDESDGSIDGDADKEKTVNHVPSRSCATRSDGSTSAGEQSDSDSCDDDVVLPPLRSFRPPPGLTLPAPPGLSLTGPLPHLFAPPGLV